MHIDDYPQLKPFGKLTYVPAYMCFRTFRNEPNGRKMEKWEEDIIANGRNYEHSGGAVHQNKLDAVLRIASAIESITRKDPKAVCSFPLASLTTHIFYRRCKTYLQKSRVLSCCSMKVISKPPINLATMRLLAKSTSALASRMPGLKKFTNADSSPHGL